MLDAQNRIKAIHKINDAVGIKILFIVKIFICPNYILELTIVSSLMLKEL